MFKSKDSKPPWRGYDRNDVVGLLVAQLAERYSHSTTKKKSLEQFGEFWGADLSLISDRAELLDALNRRTSDEVQYWHQHQNDRWVRQERGVEGRFGAIGEQRKLGLLQHGRTMLDEVRSERALREDEAGGGRAADSGTRSQGCSGRLRRLLRRTAEFAAANGRSSSEKSKPNPTQWWLSR